MKVVAMQGRKRNTLTFSTPHSPTSPLLWHRGPAHRSAHPASRGHLRVHHLQRQRHQGPDCVRAAQTDVLLPPGPGHCPGNPPPQCPAPPQPTRHHSSLVDGRLCLHPPSSRPSAPAPRPLPPAPLLPPPSNRLVPMATSTAPRFLPTTSSAPVLWFPPSSDPLVSVSDERSGQAWANLRSGGPRASRYAS